MPPLSLVRLLLILLISLCVGIYMYRKAIAFMKTLELKNTSPIRLGLALLISALTVLPTVSLFLRFEVDLREHSVMYFLFTITSLWFIYSLGLLLVFLPIDLTQYIHKIFSRYLPKLIKKNIKNSPVDKALNEGKIQEKVFDQSRRDFLTKASSLAPFALGFGFPGLITTYSILNNRSDFIVNKQSLFFPNLPVELCGLKIAQISDIHSGLYMPQRKMEEITEVVNSVNADVVVLTGDFVSSYKEEIDPFVKGFHGLKSTFGTYSCLGNHDEWAGAEYIHSALNSHGLKSLRNQTERILIDGTTLNVVGMDYTREKSHYLDKALSTADKEGFNLLLCHHPDFFTRAKEYNIDLMLAGHTHGGQIALDFAGFEFYPIDLFYKYPRGLYEEGTMGAQKLYVNLGVGITATPLRTVQAEVALITLGRV